VLKDAPSQKTGRTLLSGTEATHHHQSLDDIVDTKSVTSYAATVTDIHGKGVNLPPPPKGADGEKDFECPYCYIICPARYGRGRPWRTHLLQDLQPYICTYSDCEASGQLFRSRREWNEHEAGHRKAWRCPEHPLAVYSSPAGLRDHFRRQHLDSFPESQLDVIVKVGETSTIETRESCPICFLRADAEGMGDFANHVANHLERFAVFALPSSSEEDTDGASSVASRGRSGSTASQDASGMSLPSDTSEEQELHENPSNESRKSVEEPLLDDPGLQHTLVNQQLLSAESLLLIPDVSHDRIDVVLAHQVDKNESSQEDDGSDEDSIAATTDIEAHLDRLEIFRSYLLSLPGAQTVRFFKRYGAWRGHAIFMKGTHASQALNLFDNTLYPDVRLQQGTGSNSNKLKFSVQSTQVAQPPPTRQTTLETSKVSDESTSTTSILYDDERTNQSKQPILLASAVPTLHEMYRSRKLLQRDQSFAPSDSHNRVISFCYYDITRIKVDAIVNSTGQYLKPKNRSPTLNYHVHKAGGPKFTEEVISKGDLHSGQAVLTGGHNLPSEFVIHASRPRYGKHKGMGQFNILTECYRSALKIALASNFKTIAFPCLCAGGSGFPPRVAARVALQEVREFLDAHAQHPFEKIIFVVKSVSDEKAYMDFLPAFFPPTHGDLEAARSSDLSASRASLAAQALETRLQVQSVTENLSAELKLYVPEFPKEVLEELSGIDEALGSIRAFLLGSKALKHDLSDLNLLCSVMQSVCGSIEELTGSAKNMPYSGGRNHANLWHEFNSRRKTAYGDDLQGFLRDCQEFAWYLDAILTRSGIELEEMATVRLRLDQYKSKQNNQVRDRLDEALYAQEFQRETSASSKDVLRLHQVPSVAQLYASQKLEEKATMAQPSAVFNQIVCLIREDITTLDVTVMVNSTDMSFTGMGTLDRKVFNKGGYELREECTKLGVCKEGDVKLTGSYNLPSKHILHVVPPEQWRKNTKDVLRQIYREILHTAQSLQATSIAIPAIGTGMLSYPRRDCAALALEEIHRFLESVESSTMLEKIVVVVYSSNDEFVYKSLLPVYFPPIDRDINRMLPASHPFPKSAPAPQETVKAPKKTLFSSISDAVRNLGSSSSRKRPVAHTWRAINSYEEHALIGFESHAQDCDTCKNLEQVYKEKRDLCEYGYPLAQTLLWYMNMGSDQLVYTRPVQIRQSIRLEVPEGMFPLALTLLRIVEASSKDEEREHPWISPNRASTTVVRGHAEQDDAATGPTIYNAETARASVEVWSISEQSWSPVSPSECILFIRPGKLDVYEAHAPSTAQEPLLTFVLDATASIIRHSHRPGLIVSGAVSAQFDNNKRIMLVSQYEAESDTLLAILKRANPDFFVGSGGSKTSLKDPWRSETTGNADNGGQATSVLATSGSSQTDQRLSAEPTQGGPLKGRLSPLQEKMQRLSEAASSFNGQQPQQQSATITQLGADIPSSEQPQLPQDKSLAERFHATLTSLEHRILQHLNEDLKSRPGSYIGQSTNDIALALNKPLVVVSVAIESLAMQDYIHNTINENNWVVSHPPEELPALRGSNLGVSTGGSGSKMDKSDVLFQMDVLEQQILSFFAAFNTDSPSKKGCKSQDIAEALNQDIEEVELALDQLAEQGKIHLAPDRETWNTPLPHQHNPTGTSSSAQVEPSVGAINIRDATEFGDTPPSPILAAASSRAPSSPAKKKNTAAPNLQTLSMSEHSYYPHDPVTHWTRLDASYVDPQVLTDLGEEFHTEGYSSVLHRLIRRGELKNWVQKTLDLRLKRDETARAGGGVSGHTWLGKGKERERDDGRDERDRHQENLDRLLAGDLREEELRHFKADEEGERKR
jgi:O-acetyl-ADP-ribose deacetylase (regulator of RNase III)